LQWAARYGVQFKSNDRDYYLKARRGVVLATGGFEWNKEYVRAFLRGPMTHPASMPTNTGNGLRMAMKAGAMLANMREAWWMPACNVPLGENPTGRVLVAKQRTLPHSIMINRQGARFVNEAANYNAFGGAFHQFDAGRFSYSNLPCHLFTNISLYKGALHSATRK
jgi:succinate dehydrogenase/fumarate reductase flavoprotein subunit